MDLGEELPQKNENETVNPIVAWDPFFDNNTSPQIKEINSSSKNIIVGSQQNETKNQPELYDLIYTDKIPQQEEKGNTIMDMQDVFVDPKVKEAEERFKKMTLLE